MSEMLDVVCSQYTDGGSECLYPQSRIHAQSYGKGYFWVYLAGRKLQKLFLRYFCS